MYYKFAETQVDPHDDNAIASFYEQGYLLGRVRPGYMSQTKSLRLDLAGFQPNSENRRILRKFSEQDYHLAVVDLPLADNDYNWKLHKIGKDFYTNKFADIQFSASKIKELVTADFSFNKLFIFVQSRGSYEQVGPKDLIENGLGFCICYVGTDFLHYCYPFYELNIDHNNLGMYMMLQSILWAQMHGLRYVYLGGVTRPSDKYKLQFSGLEWYNGENWQNDLLVVKSELDQIPS